MEEGSLAVAFGLKEFDTSGFSSFHSYSRREQEKTFSFRPASESSFQVSFID